MGSLLLGDGTGLVLPLLSLEQGVGDLDRMQVRAAHPPVRVELCAWRACSLLWPFGFSCSSSAGRCDRLAGCRYIISPAGFFFFLPFSGVKGKVEGDPPGWELGQGMGLGSLRPHSDPALERGLCCSILGPYVLGLDLCPPSQLCLGAN